MHLNLVKILSFLQLGFVVGANPLLGCMLNGYRETPPKKNLFVVGADETSSSEPAKGQKERVVSDVVGESVIGRRRERRSAGTLHASAVYLFPTLLSIFVCLFVCCYKTWKILPCLLSWPRSKTPGSLSRRTA